MVATAATIVAVPTALAIAPQALVATISTSAATKSGIGAAVGLATSLVSSKNSRAPVDQKVSAAIAGTIAGAATGPLNISPVIGGSSAVFSRLVTDAISGQGLLSGTEGAIEFANGAGASYIAATAQGLGPLGQIVVAGSAKFVLDEGVDAAIGGSESSVLNRQELGGAYRHSFGGSR
jgi:hypothetical protein